MAKHTLALYNHLANDTKILPRSVTFANFVWTASDPTKFGQHEQKYQEIEQRMFDEFAECFGKSFDDVSELFESLGTEFHVVLYPTSFLIESNPPERAGKLNVTSVAHNAS